MVSKTHSVAFPKELSGGALNRVYFLETDSKNLVMKIWDSGVRNNTLRFRRELEAYKLQNLPTPQLLAWSEEDRFIVYSYLEGISLKEVSREQIPITPKELAREISKIHNSHEKTQGNLQDYLKFLFEEIILDVKAVPKEGKYVEVVTSTLKKQEDRLKELSKRYSKPITLTRIHGDMNGSNIIVSEDGTCSGFLDWEFSHIGSPYLDIGQFTNLDDDFSRKLKNEYFSLNNMSIDKKLYDFFVEYFLFKLSKNYFYLKEVKQQDEKRLRIIKSKLKRIMDIHGTDADLEDIIT